MKRVFLFAAVLACSAMLVAPAYANFIDFQSMSVGTVVTNQFAPQGALFSTTSGVAEVIDDFSNGGRQLYNFTSGIFRIDFIGSATNVSFDAGIWDGLATASINMYGAGNVFLGNITNTTTGGYEFFNLAGYGAISWIDFDSSADGAFAAMDNLRFDNPVPEPSTWIALIAGMGVLGVLRFRS